jgi:hypothetical protein
MWSDGPEVEHGAHFLILYYPECDQVVPYHLIYHNVLC